MALTDKLTAIADAIRGKTGGTEGMSLDAMVSAIEGIEVGGRGIPYATGSFTLATIGSATITHNLNSTKVFVVWAIDENPAIFKNRYKAVMGFTVSNGVFPELTMDTSAYNSDTGVATEVPTGPDDTNLMTSVEHGSPYIRYAALEKAYRHIANTDPNTFKLMGHEGFEAGRLYKWVAVDISGIIPWA